jgi:hypothetical protein
MATQLARRPAVPFHLGLTEPIDETAITSSPAIEGSYDPAAQIWKLPDGTPLADSSTIINDATDFTLTFSHVGDTYRQDDEKLDS